MRIFTKIYRQLSAKTDPDDLTGGEASEDAYIRYYTRDGEGPLFPEFLRTELFVRKL